MFKTHPDVLPKLANGADLMLPGVIRSATDLKSWGSYKKDDIFGINLSSNKSAIAVGFLAHDSYDMYMSGGKGVAVHVAHLFGDKLWGMEPTVCLQPPTQVATTLSLSLDDFPALGSEPLPKEDVSKEVPEIMDQLSVNDEPELNPDYILKAAFLNCLKLHGRKLNLPLLTSTFYPQYVQPSLESPLDVKKTSYRKVGTFLRAMANENFIVIQEESKGVEKILSVNIDHPEILKYMPRKIEKVSETVENKPHLLLTKMTEVYSVTEKTRKLFSHFNHGVGTNLDEKQIKDHIKDYISRNKLLDKTIHKVNLDDILIEASDREGVLSTEELTHAIKLNMDATFEMRTQDKIAAKGGKKPMIHITTATRSGNKKVSLIKTQEI